MGEAYPRHIRCRLRRCELRRLSFRTGCSHDVVCAKGRTRSTSSVCCRARNPRNIRGHGLPPTSISEQRFRPCALRKVSSPVAHRWYSSLIRFASIGVLCRPYNYPIVAVFCVGRRQASSRAKSCASSWRLFCVVSHASLSET